MKNYKDLHTIIKSLTKAEKRNFKMCVSSSLKSNNNYTLLFDAINTQKSYDENKLLKKLKNHTFSQQIARTKYLLYEQILKSLRLLYSTRTKRSEIEIMLNSVEILFHKTLYQQAYEVLKRAKKIALNFELLGLQQKILEWELQLFPLLKKQKSIPSTMKQLCIDYEQVAQKVETENVYKTLHAKARLYYDSFSDSIYSSEKTTVFREVMDNSYMKNATTADTFLSSVLFYEIQFLNARVYSNNKNALHFGNTLFNIWKNSSEKKEILKTVFIRQLRDYTLHKNEFDVDRNFTSILEEWELIIPFSKEEEILLKKEIEYINSMIQSRTSKFLTNTQTQGKYLPKIIAISIN